MKIEVFDKNTNKKIGYENFSKNVYDWRHDGEKSFDFLVEDDLKTDYELGNFKLEDCTNEEHIDNETVRFFITKYKLLCINKNPSKQFDDEENSKWENFPKADGN